MSEFSTVDSGTRFYSSRFNLSFRKQFDFSFGKLIPVLAKFVLPGDIWKIGGNVLVRYQPTLAPVLTKSNIRVRYFFVPLRLLYDNTEEIITGSKNGKLIQTTLPTFPDICTRPSDGSDMELTVKKWSFYDYLGFPCVKYKKDQFCNPAMYWAKAYTRIYWDYFRDENLFTLTDDFEEYFTKYVANGYLGEDCFNVNLRKDYFTSALPWQLKGVAPSFSVDSNLVWKARDGSVVATDVGAKLNQITSVVGTLDKFHANAGESVDNKDGIFYVKGSAFNMDDLRTMSAQTRVFERLARCGSRYVEYLRANFGTAPADGTLQRAQYLGGFKQPIVTTEVVQTGSSSDTNNPVGTLRGHGISSGGNSIKPFRAKEFGVLFGLMDVIPDLQYTQGIDREFTYKNRFDFFNPSFQNLSEQEIRNGEVFYSDDDKNDETFGFQGIYSELRSSQDKIVGDMRDTLSYWNQAIKFSSRPNLNSSFISAESYHANFMAPFAVQSGAKPMICDFFNSLDVYRPMIRNPVPGLIDHN